MDAFISLVAIGLLAGAFLLPTLVQSSSARGSLPPPPSPRFSLCPCCRASTRATWSRWRRAYGNIFRRTSSSSRLTTMNSPSLMEKSKILGSSLDKLHSDMMDAQSLSTLPSAPPNAPGIREVSLPTGTTPCSCGAWRKCAPDFSHSWDHTALVRRYLETKGD